MEESFRRHSPRSTRRRAARGASNLVDARLLLSALISFCAMPPRRANKRNRPSQVSQPGRSNQLSQGFSAPLVTIRPSNKKYEWTSPRPDMRTAPDDFEASWEHDLEQNFDFLSGFPGNIIAWLNPRVVQVLSEDPVNVVDVQQSPIRAICTWQRELAKAVLAEPDFEKTWTELDDARRREVVLEGIVRAMGLTESTEGDRQWAPESTLKNLTADGGKEYLRILKCLTPQNPDEPLVEPRKVPHPTMDHLFTLSPREQGDPGCQAVVLVYTMRRLFILTAIIYNIFLALVSGGTTTKTLLTEPWQHNRPALEEPESQNVLVPVPQPYHNFICSPALKRQLDLLKGDGSYDYFVRHVTPVVCLQLYSLHRPDRSP